MSPWVFQVIDFSHTCGDWTLQCHLANDNTIYITVISAGCPALRYVFLEVPFAITSKSDTPAPWLPSTYEKSEFPIPHTWLFNYNMTCFVSCTAQQSDCTIQGFWWQETHLLYQMQIPCFQSIVVQTMYPPLNILHVTSGVSRSVGRNSKYWVHRLRCAKDVPSVHDLKGHSNDQLNATDKFLQRMWFHADCHTWSD